VVCSLQNGCCTYGSSWSSQVCCQGAPHAVHCWCAALLQYRTSHNYKDQTFLGARLGDKILMGL